MPGGRGWHVRTAAHVVVHRPRLTAVPQQHPDRAFVHSPEPFQHSVHHTHPFFRPRGARPDVGKACCSNLRNGWRWVRGDSASRWPAVDVGDASLACDYESLVAAIWPTVGRTVECGYGPPKNEPKASSIGRAAFLNRMNSMTIAKPAASSVCASSGSSKSEASTAPTTPAAKTPAILSGS